MRQAPGGAGAEEEGRQGGAGKVITQFAEGGDNAAPPHGPRWLEALEASGISDALRATATAYVATKMLRVGSVLTRDISRLHAVERERWLRGRALRKARAVTVLLNGPVPPDVAELEAVLEYRLGGTHRAVIAWRDPAADGGPDALEDVVREVVGRAGLVVRVDVHAVWGGDLNRSARTCPTASAWPSVPRARGSRGSGPRTARRASRARSPR